MMLLESMQRIAMYRGVFVWKCYVGWDLICL